MKQASILEELFFNSSSKQDGNKVILKNPSSIFNWVKRIIAFLFGSFIIYLYSMIFMELDTQNLSEYLQEIFFVSLFGFGFIYYSIFRTKIHKTCFIEFSENQLVGRLPAPLQSYPQGRALALRLMYSPKFIEFSYEYSNIESIIIELTKIIINRKDGISQEIDLSNFDYDKLKAVKDKFKEIQNLNFADTMKAL